MMGGNTRKEVYAMKAVRPYAKITVTPKGERALTGGHPWVYEGEVVSIEGAAEDGGLADVVSQRGSWLGCGFYNSRSKIRVRLVSRNANDDFSDDFGRGGCATPGSTARR